MSTATGPLPGDCLRDRYRLDRAIARGGMATVWRGTDLALRRPVAVKVLHRHLGDDPGVVARFRHEARAAARLNHPGIVTIFDIVTESGISALILEYVDGITLRELLDENGPLDPDLAVRLVADTAAACHVAHRAGIVHRDIKPGNVLLTATDGEDDVPGGLAVRVTDFGIAKAVEASADRLTAGGAIVGTAKYLAPEQVRSEPVDARTDVFSLGVLLYECLTGTVPWVAESDLATATARLHVAPVPPSRSRPGISPALEAVVLRALAPRPDDRFPTAAAFRTALLDAAAPTRDPSRPGRRAGPVALAAVAVTVTALVIGLTRSGGDGPAPVATAMSTPAEAPAAKTLDPVSRVRVPVRATTYDALGDGEENDELAGFAADDVTDSTRIWRTECYRGDFAAAGKRGVGLILTAASGVDFVGLDLMTSQPGWTATIYISAEDAGALRDAQLERWGPPVAGVVGDRPTVGVSFPPVAGRSLLVLFDSLAGIAPDDCFGARPMSRWIGVVEARPYGR